MDNEQNIAEQPNAPVTDPSSEPNSNETEQTKENSAPKQSFDSERFKMRIRAEVPRSGIIPEAHAIGLFKKSLTSRRRLMITTAIAIAIELILMAVTGQFILDAEIPKLLRLGTILIVLFGALITGYLLALAIGDLVFPGPWREKMRLGSGYVPESFKDQKALLKNKDIYFFLLCAVCIVAVIAGGDRITGKQLDYYFGTGGLISRMQSENPADRYAAIDVVANPLKEKNWPEQDLRDAVANLLNDPDDKVAAFATYCGGRMQLVEYSDRFIANLEHPAPEVRIEAAYALGRMQWKQARVPLMKAFDKAKAGGRQTADELSTIIFAFTLMDDYSPAIPITQLLESCEPNPEQCSDDLIANAFFFERVAKNKAAADIALRYLTSDKTNIPQKCYATHALRFTASEQHAERLKDVFYQIDQETQCELVYRKTHEEAVHVLFEAEPLRAVLLRAIGNQMLMSNYDWIWQIGANEKENPSTRKVAELYTRALLKKEEEKKKK